MISAKNSALCERNTMKNFLKLLTIIVPLVPFTTLGNSISDPLIRSLASSEGYIISYDASLEGQPFNIYLPEVSTEIVSKSRDGYCASIRVANNKDNTTYRMNWEVKVFTPAMVNGINAGLGQKMEEVAPYIYSLTGNALEVGEEVSVEFCAKIDSELSDASMIEVSEIGGNGWREWFAIVDGLIDERKDLIMETAQSPEEELRRICRERFFSNYTILSGDEQIDRYKSFSFERTIGFCHN